MIETEVHFENHKSVIQEELMKANSSVYIAVAWINFRIYFEIFEEIIDKKIDLNIICSDNIQNKSHQTEISTLQNKGAKIRLLKMPYLKNHMHHKFVIIDDNVIINGSFNWSPNAEKSIENIMIIRNATESVKKFKDEFKRLLTIESETIRNLQRKNNCTVKECDGNLYNILVFSEQSTKYFETYADIISFCNECYEYSRVKECISNTQLRILLSELVSVSDDYEFEYVHDFISDLLRSYQNDDSIIHAIGIVNTSLDGWDNEQVNTNVLWKNKFVGNNLPDKFEDEDFGVLYDN